MSREIKIMLLGILLTILLVSLFCFFRFRSLQKAYTADQNAKIERTMRLYIIIMTMLFIMLMVMTLYIVLYLKQRQ
ncbi:MAG: hypothetical protein IKE12_01355 [Erysipelotrichaceae bacterium]|nr:hypothetical protein [Erysipelotrichaceae bacterium]MBR2600347.1 hypothetical protein [Erysipelotrichaceae bacterium]MBR2791293.1 hypothetical protein [Erysipelotrichaceae bacterium]MBR6957532.1 hypothetical protein [Erysipelotrichaceae bacterium]